MKLLSKSDIKKTKSDGLERVREINEYVSKKNKELNDLKIKFDERKKIILTDFVVFAEKITQDKNKLESTLSSTEEKKDFALHSLATISVDANEKYEQAKDSRERVAKIQIDLEVREKNVNNKSSELRDREHMLNTLAADVSERSLIARLDERDIELLKVKTNIEFTAREKKIKSDEESIMNRLGELGMAAQANKKTAQLLKEREKQFEEEMRIEKIKLKDGRETLERAFQELRSKQK